MIDAKTDLLQSPELHQLLTGFPQISHVSFDRLNILIRKFNFSVINTQENNLTVCVVYLLKHYQQYSSLLKYSEHFRVWQMHQTFYSCFPRFLRIASFFSKSSHQHAPICNIISGHCCEICGEWKADTRSLVYAIKRLNGREQQHYRRIHVTLQIKILSFGLFRCGRGYNVTPASDLPCSFRVFNSHL